VSALLQNIERWYRARQPREQNILLAAAVVVPLLILYLAVWQPIAESRAGLHRELPRLREASSQFSMQADEAGRLRSRAPARQGARSARAAVEDTAARAGITLQGIDSGAGDRTTIQVSVVSFDALSRWLGELASTEGLVVENLQMSAASEGQVKVDRLVLIPAARRAPERQG